MTTTRTRKPKVITDKQYLGLLATRLGAMKAYEADPTPENQVAKNIARAAVRMARKTRKAAAEAA
jgi:hypothetical protein